ncbi:MAG: hypothetical protein AAFR35_10045 [Pseudomonadota bacterium]
MTTITNTFPPAPGIQHQRAHAMLATIASRLGAYFAARRAARLQKRSDFIVSQLDPRLLRDIGLDPARYTRPTYGPQEHRARAYGAW